MPEANATPSPLPCGRPRPGLPANRELPGSQVSWRARLDDYLSQQKLKHSDQRIKIVELILSEGRHFNSQEIVKKVQDHYPGIGAATVYRNIKLLEEAGVLKETLIDDGRQAVFEVSDSDDDHHDHIVCLDCSEIFEFHDGAIEALQDKISKKLHFKQERHRHVIYSRCQWAADHQ